MVAHTPCSITHGGGGPRRLSAPASRIGEGEGNHEGCQGLGGKFSYATLDDAMVDCDPLLPFGLLTVHYPGTQPGKSVYNSTRYHSPEIVVL